MAHQKSVQLFEKTLNKQKGLKLAKDLQKAKIPKISKKLPTQVCKKTQIKKRSNKQRSGMGWPIL